jgi:hypothetical protein
MGGFDQAAEIDSVASSTGEEGEDTCAEDEDEDEDEDEAEDEVELILGEKGEVGSIWHMFKVKWKGYPVEEATWEPSSCCEGCQELVDEYQAATRARAPAGSTGDADQ